MPDQRMKSMITNIRYSSMTQVFHWPTVLLVGAAWLLSEGGREPRVYAAERASSLTLHETFGVLVLLVLVLRVAWRMFDHVPEEPPASKLVHWVLYAMLAAVPLRRLSVPSMKATR
jgi:cytochrome b561